MRKIYSFISLAALAGAVLVSCNKSEMIQDNTEQGPFTYTFTLSDDATRSTIDQEGDNKVINWEDGDQLGVYAVTTEGTSYNRFANIDLTKTPNEFSISSYYALVSGNYVYTYAPYNKRNSGENYQDPSSIALEIPVIQTQESTSFKANAMPMAGTPYQMKESLDAKTDKPVGDIKMINLGAIIDFKIFTGDNNLASEQVQSVTFKANSAIAGLFEYDLTSVNYGNVSTLSISGYTEKTVKTEVSNPATLGSARDNAYDVYMVVAPGSYTGTVIVETDKAKYTFPISTSKIFKRNVIYNLGVNLRDDEEIREAILPDYNYEWNLVTSSAQIVEGANVVIAAKDANFAMSQTQNDNNRATAAISKSDNILTWVDGSLVQVFEIVKGSKDNTFAFRCTDGDKKGSYIYAASSSSNHLKSSTTLSDDASWQITINNGTSIVAQGNNSRNNLKYNSGSNIFSCYQSGQGDVELYIKGKAADPNAKAIISNGTIDAHATGVSADYSDAYSLKNINETNETIVVTSTENILNPSASNGTVSFSMAPNYTSTTVDGTITLTLANSNPEVKAEIPVKQKASSLKTSVSEIIIPADATSASFTVTSDEFAWTITSNNTNVTFSTSGSEVTVTSTIEASDVVQTIATLTITRTDNDPQEKTVVIKKAKKGEVVLATLTNANIVAAGEAGSGYKEWNLTDNNRNEYVAYAIKNKHSNATSSYHYLQIKKYASNTAYFIQIPDLGSAISKITMTVSGTSQAMDGGGNNATLFFSSSNETSANGDGVASGTGTSKVTIDASALNLKGGFITSSAAVRIWDITIYK